MALTHRKAPAMTTPTQTRPASQDQTQKPADAPKTGDQAQTQAETATCSYPVVTGTQSDGKTKITKPCLKSKGHEGDHSARKPAVRLDRSVITADLLSTIEDVPSDEDTSMFISEADHEDPQQKLIDSHVLLAKQAYEKAGKPTTMAKAVKTGAAKRYFIEPQNLPALKVMLREGGKFHSVRVHVDKARKHKDGRTMVYWRVSVPDTKANVTPEQKKETAEAKK